MYALINRVVETCFLDRIEGLLTLIRLRGTLKIGGIGFRVYGLDAVLNAFRSQQEDKCNAEKTCHLCRILNNIAYGRPAATREEILEAAGVMPHHTNRATLPVAWAKHGFA